MSQSDYIRHKKVANILKYQENLGNVLNSQDLTSFKTFALSNTIENSHLTYNELLPEDRQNVFNMAITRNCPNILLCMDTNNRPNRVKQSMPMFSHYRGKISKNGYFWEQKPKHLLCLEKEFKACDSFFFKRKFSFVRNG